METISRLVLISSFLLAMISPQEAMAGGCGPTGCSAAAYVAPSVKSAPATASSSHAFTAIGGSRVADINLSQEAQDVINAGGKEEPLPKGFSTAAERAKLIAKEPPLSGWQEVPRPVSRTLSPYSIATRASRNSRSEVQRSPAGPVKPVSAVKVATAANAKSRN